MEAGHMLRQVQLQSEHLQNTLVFNLNEKLQGAQKIVIP